MDDGGAVSVGGGVAEGIGVAEALGVAEGAAVGVDEGVMVGVAVGVAEGVAVATMQGAAGAGGDDRPIDSAKMCSSTRTRVAPRAGRGETGKRSAATRLPRSSPIAV